MTNKFKRVAQLVYVALYLIFNLTGSMGCSSGSQDATTNTTTDPNDQQLLSEFDTVRDRENEYGYSPPKSTFGDWGHYRYYNGKVSLQEGAKTIGKLITIFSFHVLMLVIPLLIIVLIPESLFHGFEMTAEGALFIASGIILHGMNWIAELDSGDWVIGCLVVPGIILVLLSFFSVHLSVGQKVALVLIMPIIMSMLTLFKVLDLWMSALMSGSFIALSLVALAIFVVIQEVKGGGHAAPAKAGHH